jgi:PleD family two-component response regulator
MAACSWAGIADTSETGEWQSLLQLADQRLSHAKRLGRDRVLASVS